jgi:hypothetical protein
MIEIVGIIVIVYSDSRVVEARYKTNAEWALKEYSELE